MSKLAVSVTSRVHDLLFNSNRLTVLESQHVIKINVYIVFEQADTYYFVIFAEKVALFGKTDNMASPVFLSL